MPETATIEAPVEAPVVADPAADPAQEAPPTPAPGVTPAPEGDAAPGTEGDSGRDYSAVEAELEVEVERRVAERAEKAEAAAVARATVRAKEADDGESARMQLYDTAEAGARASAMKVRELAATGELDDRTLDEHFNPIIAGVQALAAKGNEATVKAFLASALPDMTDDEKQALDVPLHSFRQKGQFDALLPKVAELALARKDVEIADLKKQLGNRAGLKAAAEKLANLTNGVGPGVGSETPAGGPQDQRSDNEILADPNTPVAKLAEIRNRQRGG